MQSISFIIHRSNNQVRQIILDIRRKGAVTLHMFALRFKTGGTRAFDRLTCGYGKTAADAGV